MAEPVILFLFCHSQVGKPFVVWTKFSQCVVPENIHTSHERDFWYGTPPSRTSHSIFKIQFLFCFVENSTISHKGNVGYRWQVHALLGYKKSYECQCISWYMGTNDVFQVLKIWQTAGECNLRVAMAYITKCESNHTMLFIIFSPKL